MRSRRVALGLSLLAMGASLLMAAPGRAAGPPSYAALAPGGITELAENVPVSIVYVGIDPDLSQVAAELPQTSSPIMRLPEIYSRSTRRSRTCS